MTNGLIIFRRNLLQAGRCVCIILLIQRGGVPNTWAPRDVGFGWTLSSNIVSLCVYFLQCPSVLASSGTKQPRSGVYPGVATMVHRTQVKNYFLWYIPYMYSVWHPDSKWEACVIYTRTPVNFRSRSAPGRGSRESSSRWDAVQGVTSKFWGFRITFYSKTRQKHFFDFLRLSKSLTVNLIFWKALILINTTNMNLNLSSFVSSWI